MVYKVRLTLDLMEPSLLLIIFRLHSEILPVPICKLLFLCNIPNCSLKKIETYRQASGNGHETINQRATAAATCMHLPNLSCSLISVCWLFFAVFLLQKPDSSPVLGKSDLQIDSYVIEFLALAQRPRHNGEFCIRKWGWGPLLISWFYLI